MSVLVTGVAGFIGSFVAARLLDRGDAVTGVDSLNDYYDPSLKRARLARLQAKPRFAFEKLDLADRAASTALFARHRPTRVVHLAAQAGVRHSIENPYAYVDANVVAFLNILEAVRETDIAHLVYASTSAVYGGNAQLPFATEDAADQPLSMYAATKKSNELMAHAYSHLFNLATTGLRFFTVYGPWGRPDMALFKFTKAMLAGEPIQVFNHGNHVRDFTYCDDIVRGIIAALDRPPEGDPNWRGTHPAPDRSSAPWRLYNIGNQRPVELMKYIELLESELGIRADKTFLPLQPGDVPATYADVETFVEDTHYRPSTPVDVGVRKFVRWYRRYHDV